MTLTTLKWSVERYHQAIDAGIFDDRPVELLSGEIVVMPPEREPHAYHNSELGDYLRSLLGDRAKVREAHPIALDDDSEPCPDLAIVRSLGPVYRDRHPSPGDIYWLVEISNTTLAKDLGDKKTAYARAGIAEYWVVNLQQRQLHCFRDRRGERYDSERILTEGAISPLAFPDIKISLPRLIDP